MRSIKAGSWLEDLIEVYNELGGSARYSEVYPLAEKRRKGRGASWTAEAEASIRRTVEDHARSSKNFRGREVFYSVNGHGRGVWALMPEYLRSPTIAELPLENERMYSQGLEGILKEVSYLKRSRDPKLAEARKKLDDYRCQICSFRYETPGGGFVIDVHHLNPIGALDHEVVTQIEDLICLCPNCHRIAHTGVAAPRSLEELRGLRLQT